MIQKQLIHALTSVLLLIAAVSCTGEEAPDSVDYLTIENSLIRIPDVGGQAAMDIRCSGAWSLDFVSWSSENHDWCRPDALEGEGDMSVIFSCDRSESSREERTVTVSVTSKGKTRMARIIQAPTELGEGEVMLNGIIWATSNLADAGVFATDIETVGALFQFNRKKAWPYDPKHNMGKFDGYEPSKAGMVPVPGFVQACASYGDPHTLFDEGGGAIMDDNAWRSVNDPCPSGWRVPTQAEIVSTLGYSEDHCKTTDKFNCIRVNAGERGFSVNGFIVGWGQDVPSDITKDNITKRGGMFVPMSGWISAGGYLDRTWLVCLRGSTSYSDTMSGLYLSTWVDYCDHWGYGDGQKVRASAVRCVKKQQSSI